MDVACSAVENDEVQGPSRVYCTHLQLRRLCCNPATRSSLEHCGDIVSCPEEEEAAVGGRREESERASEREREKSHHAQTCAGERSGLMVEKSLFARCPERRAEDLSELKACRSSRPTALRVTKVTGNIRTEFGQKKNN
jgi:hypothetical protein